MLSPAATALTPSSLNSRMQMEYTGVLEKRPLCRLKRNSSLAGL